MTKITYKMVNEYGVMHVVRDRRFTQDDRLKDWEFTQSVANRFVKRWAQRNNSFVGPVTLLVTTPTKSHYGVIAWKWKASKCLTQVQLDALLLKEAKEKAEWAEKNPPRYELIGSASS